MKADAPVVKHDAPTDICDKDDGAFVIPGCDAMPFAVITFALMLQQTWNDCLLLLDVFAAQSFTKRVKMKMGHVPTIQVLHIPDFGSSENLFTTSCRCT